MVNTPYLSPTDYSSVCVRQSYVQTCPPRFSVDQTVVPDGLSANKPGSLVLSTEKHWNPIVSSENVQAIWVPNSPLPEENLELQAALLRMDRAALAPLLQKNAHVTKCIRAHEYAVHEGLDQVDAYFCNLLLSAYSDCGYIHLARSVFDRMNIHNVVSWTSMITSYVNNGLADEALFTLKCMCLDGVHPNQITFLAALSACARAGYLEEGMTLHVLIASHGFDSDVAVNTGLIKMYGQCGDIERAVLVFGRISSQDLIAWTAIISVHARLGFSEKVLQLFHEMERGNVQPDNFTLASVISACGDLMNLTQGREIHRHVLEKKLPIDNGLCASLISMYVKCGSLKEAVRTFKQIREPDAVSFTTILSALTQNGEMQAALQIYQAMSTRKFAPTANIFSVLLCMCAESKVLSKGQEIHSQIIKHGLTWELRLMNALLYMYGKCGRILQAKTIFRNMPERDVVSWTTMMNFFLEKDLSLEVFPLLDQMEQAGVKPDCHTYMTVLKACAVLCMQQQGRSLHASVIGRGLPLDGSLGTSLVEFYGKCGALEDGKRVFNCMNYQDQSSWNSIIMAHVLEGDGKTVVQLFKQMLKKNVAPDAITFVRLLSGCSHAGMVKEGCTYFESMRQVYSIPPVIEHHGCIVDLLGQNACLDAAEDFIEKTPIRTSAGMWSALLKSCQKYGDLVRAKRAANFFMVCEPENSSPYVQLSRMCASSGQIKDAEKLLQRMADLGLRKKPGCTYIELNKVPYRFLASDGFCKDKNAVLEMLEKLKKGAKEMGYIPDTELVLDDVSEELKQHLLGHHSERMALAFGLLSTPPGARLYLAKNLRMCADCHSFMRAVTKVVARQIVLRDTSRIHRFKDGECSCGDHW